MASAPHGRVAVLLLLWPIAALHRVEMLGTAGAHASPYAHPAQQCYFLPVTKTLQVAAIKVPGVAWRLPAALCPLLFPFRNQCPSLVQADPRATHCI